MFFFYYVVIFANNNFKINLLRIFLVIFLQKLIVDLFFLIMNYEYA